MSNDLTKQDLYEGVKTLIETDAIHVHLPQQKLFTLFSVGFQYLLFQSTRNPGSYVIRVEDGHLAEKLAKKAKDPSTRKSRPMMDMEMEEVDETSFPDTIKNGQYLKTLMESAPRTITIAFEENFEGTTQVNFPFIKKEKERTISGVTIHDDVEWED